MKGLGRASEVKKSRCRVVRGTKSFEKKPEAYEFNSPKAKSKRSDQL